MPRVRADELTHVLAEEAGVGQVRAESQFMRIAFFASNLVSACWSGAAAYYRGILRALYSRGHKITLYESDAYARQLHRDIDGPPWADVVVYPAIEEGVLRALYSARGA